MPRRTFLVTTDSHVARMVRLPGDNSDILDICEKSSCLRGIKYIRSRTVEMPASSNCSNVIGPTPFITESEVLRFIIPISSPPAPLIRLRSRRLTHRIRIQCQTDLLMQSRSAIEHIVSIWAQYRSAGP